MEVREIDFNSFGKCILISNGILDMVVTIDFGPRIIFLGFTSGKNVLFEDEARKYIVPSDDGKTDIDHAFYYYGGHRLWLNTGRPSQAIMPDNEPVIYSVLSESVRLYPQRQKYSDFQTGIEIIMGEGAADAMVIHTAKNCSRETKACGLWPVTMLAGNGLLILPQNIDDSSPDRPNRTISLWSGTDIRDDRLFLGNRYLTIRQTVGNEKPLKIGTNNIFGWAAFVGEEYTFMKRYVHVQQAVYPDFGSSCELRLGADFCEIASLGPVYRVEPEMGIKHVENLSVFQNHSAVDPEDEDEIESYIGNLS